MFKPILSSFRSDSVATLSGKMIVANLPLAGKQFRVVHRFTKIAVIYAKKTKSLLRRPIHRFHA